MKEKEKTDEMWGCLLQRLGRKLKSMKDTVSPSAVENLS